MLSVFPFEGSIPSNYFVLFIQLALEFLSLLRIHPQLSHVTTYQLLSRIIAKATSSSRAYQGEDSIFVRSEVDVLHQLSHLSEFRLRLHQLLFDFLHFLFFLHLLHRYLRNTPEHTLAPCFFTRLVEQQAHIEFNDHSFPILRLQSGNVLVHSPLVRQQLLHLCLFLRIRPDI